MKKRIPYLIMLVVMLATSVTYAWMDSSDIKEGNVIKYEYLDGSIRVPSDKFSAKLYYGVDRTENGVTVTDYFEVTRGENGELTVFDNQVPADIIKLKFQFYNQSQLNGGTGSTIKMNVYLTGVTGNKYSAATGKPLASEVLFFSVTGSSGYPANYIEVPENSMQSFDSILEPVNEDATEFRALLFKDLNIPVPQKNGTTGEDVPIEIFCYILFNREADSTYEDCTLNFNQVLVTL